MDAGSRSSGGAGFDDDDGLAARLEVSSSLKELTVRVERTGGSCCSSAGTDQLPNTLRSKHSATEQRRRSEINDRFQILRQLLPHNDQKRDKSSFLLEKVQKHEVSCPEWSQENAKIMPWANMYFRYFWKNEQNKDQIPEDTSLPHSILSLQNKDLIPEDTSLEPSHIIKSGSSPGFPCTRKTDDNNNAVATVAASGAQDQEETDPIDHTSYKSAETPSPINVAYNVLSATSSQDTIITCRGPGGKWRNVK